MMTNDGYELMQKRMHRLHVAYGRYLFDKQRGFRLIQLKRGRKILELL